MPEFRKGFVDEEPKRRSSGSRFAPDIRWREDNEEKFIQFLVPMEDVYTVNLHEWINVGEVEKNNGETYTRYETFISRKDPNIGEDYDELEDRLGQAPRERTLGVAVELEPVMETYRGRQRPKSFRVKTETYKTQEGEKIQPVIGLITQARKNFWGWCNSFHNGHAPLNEVPFAVTRQGKDKDTTYNFVPFEQLAVDLQPLFDNLDGISYLRDQNEDIEKAVADANDEVEAARAVGAALLDKRVDELADKSRYDELVGPIDKLKSRFPQQDRRPSSTPPKRENGNGGVPVDDPEKQERFAKLRQAVEGS